jgi:predicted nucleic acid-binding Zn ribbon protein
MFCSNCATEIHNPSGFCSKCGKQVGATKPKVRNGFIVAFLVVVGLIMVGVVKAYLSIQQSANTATAMRMYTTTIDPAFTVNKLSEKYYKLTVPAGANGARIQGHFAADGGSGNDIEVAVMSDDDFVNWRNGHPVRAIYNSQKVTQGTVNVSLPSNWGTYYLVFNNKFSIISPKAVHDNLTLQYTK